MAGKLELLKIITDNAVDDIIFADTAEETDDIWDSLEEDVTILMSYRYGFRSVVPKSISWLREILPTIDDRRFKQMMRVTREQFQIILRLIENHISFSGINAGKQFSTEKQLALLLYRFGAYGSGASIPRIASLGVGDGGTLDKVTKRVIQAILSIETNFIYWPGKSERDDIVSETLHELPRCIGYLDGSEIPLSEAPTLDHASYYSRKQRYGIKLQAVFDYNLKIRHLVVGYPASVHDARIFANCVLPQNPGVYFDDNQWLAADSAYRLTETVLTPFIKNSTLGTKHQRNEFNKYFSGYRVRIENCFGVLKQKFGSLKELRIRIKDRDSHEFACKWITAACVLYNIILPYLDDEDFTLYHGEKPENCDSQIYDHSEDKSDDLKRKALFNIVLAKLNL